MADRLGAGVAKALLGKAAVPDDIVLAVGLLAQALLASHDGM